MGKYIPLAIASIPIILLILMVGSFNTPFFHFISAPILFLFILLSAPFTQLLVILHLTDSKQFPTLFGFLLVALIYSAVIYCLARRTQAAFPKEVRKRRT